MEDNLIYNIPDLNNYQCRNIDEAAQGKPNLFRVLQTDKTECCSFYRKNNTRYLIGIRVVAQSSGAIIPDKSG